MNESTADQSTSSASRDFFCELCSLEFSTKNDLDEHCWTLLHHRKLDDKKGRNYGHQCTLCDQEFFGLLAFTTHIHGEKHEEAVQKWRKEQRWNEWSFSNENQLEDQSVVSESGSSRRTGVKKGGRNKRNKEKKGPSTGDSPRPLPRYSEGSLKWKFEQEDNGNKPTNGNQTDRNQGFPAPNPDQNSSLPRQQERSFEDTNQGPQKRNARDPGMEKPMSFGGQERKRVGSGESFSDYYDETDVNYQCFEGKLAFSRGSEFKRSDVKGDDGNVEPGSEADIYEQNPNRRSIKDSMYVHGSESENRNTEWRLESFGKLGGSRIRRSSKEGGQVLEASRQTVSRENGNEYRPEGRITGRDFYGLNTRTKPSNKNSEQNQENVISGRLSNSRPKEQEKRNSRKGKPHKLASNNSSRSEGSDNVIVVSSDSSLNLSGDADSFRSETGSSGKKSKKMLRDENREDRKRQRRQRKYEKEMEEKMVRIQQDAISGIPGEESLSQSRQNYSNIYSNYRKHEGVTTAAATKQTDASNDITSLASAPQETAQHLDMFTSEEKGISSETVNPSHMTTSAPRVASRGAEKDSNSAQTSKLETAESLPKHQREAMLRSALGIKTEPVEESEETSNSSLCSAKIKEEPDKGKTPSLFTTDTTVLRVSSHMNTVEDGPRSLVSSIASHTSIPMTSVHVALTTPSISPPRPQCMFVCADGVRCDAVTWNKAYCNYHLWLSEEERKNGKALSGSTNTVPFSRDGLEHLGVATVESRAFYAPSSSGISTPAAPTICLSSMTTSMLPGRIQPEPVRPKFRFATVTLPTTGKGDASNMKDAHTAEKARTEDTATSESNHKNIIHGEDWKAGRERKLSQAGEIDLNETSPKSLKASQTRRENELGNSLPKRFVATQLRPRRASTGVREEDRFDVSVPAIGKTLSGLGESHARLSVFQRGRRSSWNTAVDSSPIMPPASAMLVSPSGVDLNVKQEKSGEPVHAAAVGMIDLNNSTGLIGRPHLLETDVGNVPVGQSRYDIAGSTSSVIRFGTSPPRVLTPERKSVSSLGRSSVSPVAIPFSGSGIAQELKLAMPASGSLLSNATTKHDFPSRTSPANESQTPPRTEPPGSLRFPKSSGGSPKGALANVALDLSMTNLPPAVRRALALRYGSKKGGVGESVAVPATVAPNISKSRSRFVEGSKVQSHTQAHDLPQLENQARQVQPTTDHSQVARIARAVRSRRSVSLDSRSTIQVEQVDFAAPGRQSFQNISPKTPENCHGYTRESFNTSATTSGSKSTVASAVLALGSTYDARIAAVPGVSTGLSDLSRTVMQGRLPLMDLSSTSYLPASVSLISKDSKDANVNTISGAAEFAKHSSLSRFLPTTSLMSRTDIGSPPDKTSKALKETCHDKSAKLSSYLGPVLSTSVSGTERSSTRSQLKSLYRNVQSQSSSVSHNDHGNSVKPSRSLTDVHNAGDSTQRSVSHSVSHGTVDVCHDSLSRSFEGGYEGVAKLGGSAPSTSRSVSETYRDSISRSSTRSEFDVSLNSGGHPTELMDLNTKPYVRVRQDVEQELAGSPTVGLQGSSMRQKRPVGDDDETCGYTTEPGMSKRVRDTETLLAESKTVTYAPGVNVDGLLKLERDEQEQLQALNSVQSRLKLVRSHIQKLCTELDNLHSEENRIASRMSQLRSARLQILQLAVCEQRSPVHGGEESHDGNNHALASHRNPLSDKEFRSEENPYEGSSTATYDKLYRGASGVGRSSTRVSSPASQKNDFSSKSRVCCLETLQGSSSGNTSEANNPQNIGDDFPPENVFVSPVKDSFEAHKVIEGTISKQGLSQLSTTSTFTGSCDKMRVKSEFGENAAQSSLTSSSTNMNTTRSAVVNCHSTPKKAVISLAERVKKRRSMSLDDRHYLSVMAEVDTNRNVESGPLPRNNTFQQSVSTEHRPSTQDQSCNAHEKRRTSIATETTEPQINSVENCSTGCGTADEQIGRKTRKKQHRDDALRKMNQLLFPGRLPLQNGKGRKRSFSDVKVSNTIAQSKQKLQSVKEKMKQWRQNTEDMTREIGAQGSGSQSAAPGQKTSRNNPHTEVKRQKHFDRQRNDKAGDCSAARVVWCSPRSSTSSAGESHRKTTKELKKSGLFNVTKKGSSKRKKRKQERQGNDRRNHSGQTRSTKGLEMGKREEFNRKSNKLSRKEQEKMNSSTTTHPAEADNANEARPSSMVDEIPTHDEPSSPVADTTTDKTGIPNHLRIPSSTVDSFRKHILGKNTAPKSQSTTFAVKFEGHTSAVCAVQVGHATMLSSPTLNPSWLKEYMSRIYVVFDGLKAFYPIDLVCEGHLYTCSADKTTRAFDIQTGECLKTYQGHHHAVNCLQISSDGQKLFSGSNDQTVRSYNIKSGVCSHKFTFDGRVMCLHVGFELLFVGLSTGVVACICLKSNTCVERLHCHEPRGISCLTTATEGQRKLLCTGSYDSTVTIRDHKSGLLLKTLTDHEMTVLCLQVVENVVYSGAADKKAQAHNLNTGELLRSYEGHEASVTGLQVVGRVVITSCLDKLVRCYDLMSAELLQVYGGQTDMIFCVHMANGRIYTGSRDGSVMSVKLDLRVYRPCKWKDCELNFGIVSHLKDHVRDYHVMQQGNLERCLWLRCDQQFSQGDDISVVLKHVLGHVESRRARKSSR